MNQYYSFDCGCKFKVAGYNSNNQPKIEFTGKLEELPLDCVKTWDLISAGNTKGVFQLESRLGSSMAKKLKPRNIEQLSALISIMRPGCISGDTSVFIDMYQHSDGKTRFKKSTIRDVVNKLDKFSEILSYNEKSGKFIKNKIMNAFYSGDKECFKVVIKTNNRKHCKNGYKEYKLECTSDHKLLTPDGWKELKDIQIGERVLTVKRKPTRIRGLGTKYFRDICYANYRYKCIFCDWNKGSLDVNHIQENRLKNNNKDSLCYLCPNHHREFSEGNISSNKINKQRIKHILPNTIDGKWSQLVDKISVGVKDVYDISMKDPHNNFIAGGVIVHNCLEANRDGKSVSNHYIDKKNQLESIDYFHPSLEPILKTTYGEMIYQEQSMQIAQAVAGFNLQEADMLRKAIGKKKPEEMARVKTKFIQGAKQLNIINENEAEEIFGWIEKSQRYSFNASHSVSYAMNAYASAYAKAHFPRPFFASYLKFAKDKMDPQKETKELVRNATEMDIVVCVPDLRKLNKHFIIDDNKIYFGLTDIKGVGYSVFDKIVELCKTLSLNDLSWLHLLTKFLTKINSTAAKALISCGALDYYGISRTQMLFEYDIISELTSRELELLISNNNCLGESLKEVLSAKRITVKRKTSIEQLISLYYNPPYSLEDKIEWLSDTENALLGVSITCFKIDSYDISMTNSDCKAFKNTHLNKNIILAGEISNINFVKTKKGKYAGSDMAFLTIEDQFASLDSVIVFPEQLSTYRNYLFEGNVLIFAGNKSKQKDSFVVEKCFIPRS